MRSSVARRYGIGAGIEARSVLKARGRPVIGMNKIDLVPVDRDVPDDAQFVDARETLEERDERRRSFEDDATAACLDRGEVACHLDGVAEALLARDQELPS
jgi:hypothetical protein